MTLTEIVARIKNPALQEVCRSMYHGPHSPLGFWPASLSHHHAYAGGLWTHTLEVASIALALMESGQVRVRHADSVITACLWHDVAKVGEYVMVHPSQVLKDRRTLDAVGGLVWTKAPHIQDGEHPHIDASSIMFVDAIKHKNVDDGLIRHIESCILSHHGRVEWSSPFEPQSVEAELVHYADMLSARMGMRK